MTQFVVDNPKAQYENGRKIKTRMFITLTPGGRDEAEGGGQGQVQVTGRSAHREGTSGCACVSFTRRANTSFVDHLKYDHD